ncbi:MAG: KH domain-containing protein [Termitinemataceae bacterium]|nr:MAG: KH domain-containing protein [Termitinemataceae bacterium]
MEKDLTEYIVKSLVDRPDDVAVNIVEDNKGIIIELRVGEGDIGKVIGKHGRIAKAMRTVLQAAGSRNNKSVMLEILE